MRKSFLMLGVAVAALTSCTQSEVIDVAQSRSIEFEPFVDRQTRATDDILDGNEASNGFKEFYVFGAKGTKTGEGVFTADNGTDPFYLDHVKVTGGKGNWMYDPHVSWIAGKTFRFAAYANGKGDGQGEAAKYSNVTFVTEELNSSSQHVWGLDIDNYVVGEKDLIAAVPEEKTILNVTTAPPSVGLTFKHLLSKVIFQFRAVNSDPNLSMEIAGFSFTAAKQGDCKVRFTGVATNDVIGAKWDNLDKNEAYTFFNGNNVWNTGNIQDEVYVIPQSNSSVIIGNITINTKNNAGEITSSTVYKNVSLKITDHTDWKPGYVYRYIADITPGQHYIHFTTSVNTWIDDDSRNQGITSGSN